MLHGFAFWDSAHQDFPYSHVFLVGHNVVELMFACPLSKTYGSGMDWKSKRGSLRCSKMPSDWQHRFLKQKVPHILQVQVGHDVCRAVNLINKWHVKSTNGCGQGILNGIKCIDRSRCCI